MTLRHVITRTDFDFGLLGEQIIFALGVGAATILIRVDGRNEIAVIDANAVELDVDPVVVAQVIAAHIDPWDVPSPLDQLADVLDGPATIVQKLAALAIWVRRESNDRRTNRPRRRLLGG